MNKITKSVVFAFALPLLMVTGAGLASQCDLSSISQETSNCLINEANEAFQSDYQEELSKLNGSSTQSSIGNFSTSASNFTSMPPAKEQSSNETTENNNTINHDNNVPVTKKSSIRWF